MIAYGRQNITPADIQAVVKALQSDWLTQGPTIERFEQKVAAYCGAKYAVAVINATSALHIACLAAGLQKGDLLWTVPNTFVASANCGRYCGAEIDFVDIDEDTYNMSLDCLEKKLASSAVKPKIVIPVHFAGQSCEMERLYVLSQKYHFRIIEDASHAIGGTYQQKKIGACTYSDMTVFSFHPVKIITTAEGGMVLTNNRELYCKLMLYRNHGITRDSEWMQNPSGEPWYYEQIMLGFNYRMTDLQAALGVSQMDRIDEFIVRRRSLAERYQEKLQELPLRLPFQRTDTDSSWHLYVIRLCLEKIQKSKKVIFQEMYERGIKLNLHYIPVYRQPDYQRLGFQNNQFPACEQYYQEALTLPLYYDLTEQQQDEIVAHLQEVLR